MIRYSGTTKSVSESLIDIMEQTYLFLDEDDAPMLENPPAIVPTCPQFVSLCSSFLLNVFLVSIFPFSQSTPFGHLPLGSLLKPLQVASQDELLNFLFRGPTFVGHMVVRLILAIRIRTPAHDFNKKLVALSFHLSTSRLG